MYVRGGKKMTRQEIPVFKTREENVAYMNATLPIRESFDLIQRDLLIGGRVSSFYYVNGFTSEETMLKIMDALLKVKEEDMPEDIWKFANACIPYVGVDVMVDFDQILKSLLSGETCVFIDGYRACIVIDCRMYPARNVEEPDKDKSLRGSRDGFVETIVYNTAMMRRRIRHPALIMEMMEVGDSSRTDVALCYMGDRADGEEWLGIFLVDCLVLGMLLEEGLLLLRKILPEGMECLDLALEVLAVGFKCGVFWLILRLCRMILDRGLIMRLEPCLILQELLVVACRLAFHRFCDALAVAEGEVPELAVRGLNGGIAERDGKFRFPVAVVVEVFLVGMVGLCEEPIGIFPDKLDVLA